MILELGKGCFTDTDDIVAVFDLEITSQSYRTREFLRASEEAGKVKNAAEDIPKAFVLCTEPKTKDANAFTGSGSSSGSPVILVQPSPAALVRRLESAERSAVG